MWFKGTATSYQDLLDKLVGMCSEEHIATAAINAGGTGYVLNEILTVSGGTAIIAAQFQVTALGVSAAAINAAGTGYTALDVLTVVGGTGTAATIRVDTVGGSGEILTVTVLTRGAYTANPTNPVAVTGGTGSSATFNLTVDAVGAIRYVNAGAYTTTPTSPVSTTASGAGSGCTLTTTYDDCGWLVQRNDTAGGQKEVILKGEGSGADEIYVGIRTYNVVDAYNWELAGFTGYSSGLTWANQPGISPGRYNLSQNGAYVPLANASMTYWFTISSRRIMGVVKVGTNYVNLYMGFLDPFSTSSQYPYPLYIAGCCTTYNVKYSDNIVAFSGLTDPIGTLPSNANGPGFVRGPSGTWTQVANSQYQATTRTAIKTTVVQPCGSLVYTTSSENGEILFPDDKWYTDFFWSQLIPNTGVPGAATFQIRPTPTDAGLRVLFPVIVSQCYPSRIFLGEMSGLFWFHAAGGVTAEQTIEVGTDIYRIFQNCQRTQDWAFFCIKEA